MRRTFHVWQHDLFTQQVSLDEDGISAIAYRVQYRNLVSPNVHGNGALELPGLPRREFATEAQRIAIVEQGVQLDGKIAGLLETTFEQLLELEAAEQTLAQYPFNEYLVNCRREALEDLQSCRRTLELYRIVALETAPEN